MLIATVHIGACDDFIMIHAQFIIQSLVNFGVPAIPLIYH